MKYPDPFERAIEAMMELADFLVDRPDKQEEIKGTVSMLIEWKSGWENDHDNPI